MTTRYKKERYLGNDKRTSVITALETSIPSIIVSAMGLFAATIGVAFYSDVDLISSICKLLARGAVISYVLRYAYFAGNVYAVRQGNCKDNSRF
jgi:MMPL family.